jgi:Uma2 family endonuclease
VPIVIPPTEGGWTTADLEEISDDGFRVELHSGNLFIQPLASRWHSRTAFRLANALERRGLVVSTRVGVVRTEHDFRVADVAVFVAEPADPHRWDWRPDELAVVIEVVSETSEDADRFEKPRFYARAGVPEFWRVNRAGDDATILKFRLAMGREASYVETGTTTLAAVEASV